MTESKRDLTLAFLATLLGAIACFYGTGLHAHWWLTPLIPIPVLLLSTRLHYWIVWIIAFLTWSIGSLNYWHYYRHLIGLPLSICLLAVVGPALIFAACVMLYRRFALQGHFLRAILIFPSAWVTSEFLLEHWSRNSTWGNLAYTQASDLPLLQVASLTGVWGVSDAVFFFSAIIAAILTARARTRLSLVTIAAITFVLLYGFGSFRLHRTVPHTTTHIALLSNDTPGQLFPHHDDAALNSVRQYIVAIDAIADAPTLYLLPEKIFSAPTATVAQADQLFAEAARRHHAYILYGVDHHISDRTLNQSRLFSPDGQLIAAYTKHHLVPRLEDVDTPGTARILLPLPQFGDTGLSICKDMHFPLLSREYGSDGAALMLVPAWDFDVDRSLALRTSLFRSVESGFSMARASKQGILSINDARGRLLAQSPTASTGITVLTADLPVEHISTIYARFGDWFAYFDMLLFLTLLASSIISARTPVTRTATAA